MKNIDQFLALAVSKKIIDKNIVIDMLKLFEKEFPNSDIAKLIDTENVIKEITSIDDNDIIFAAVKDLFIKNSSNSGSTNLDKNIKDILSNNSVDDTLIASILDIYKEEFNEVEEEEIKVIEQEIKNILKTKETLNDKHNLKNIMTFSEATEKFHLGKSTLRQNLNYSRYRDGEVRLSKGTWLIHVNAIKRLYPAKYEMYKLEES
ncbi:MAG: helix-turn-helix domain-containing protein [Clostridium sp.]|uniref:helix-turn-helix domain-containing protein n=1 Tax=Clostridium sp. TaxID=1506 RepID=UPI002430774D|nr:MULTISPECIES: helix-turn-helix domain-containing protein [Clostridium]MDU1587053.1 helix-turn-helix domain-containing protein [Clostridium sp.]